MKIETQGDSLGTAEIGKAVQMPFLEHWQTLSSLFFLFSSRQGSRRPRTTAAAQEGGGCVNNENEEEKKKTDQIS